MSPPDTANVNPRGQSEDEKAIRAVDEAFVRDYNKGDSKALAALFTEDAEVVEADGARYRGRDPIEQGLADTFAASKGAKIAFEIEAIRFLSPDVAEEEGRSVVTPEGGAGDAPLHSALRQARRPLVHLRRPRGTRPAGPPARPAQGPRMDGRRVGR